jgi:diketogulonate reductase-like aldo/keto reductase
MTFGAQAMISLSKFIQPRNMLQRIIPSSGEALPVIGMGTWQTFDVNNTQHYPVLKDVLNEFHSAGGTLIDSSPMYGNAETVIGDLTSEMEVKDDFFYATKIWTTGLQEGIDQLNASFIKMKRTTMDLVQVHNLVDWKIHLPQLRRLKTEGKIRYTGITHYTDDSHDELEKIMIAQVPDFVQFNYSILNRHAEKRLLNIAADLGVATIINRPFGEGKLFAKVKEKPLPIWAAELGIDSWAAYFLKYIIANRFVNCVIPATGNPSHARDNLKADGGILPDAAMKKQMIDYLEKLQ